MSARKIANHSSINGDSTHTRLLLSANAIRVRKNGMEFRAAEAIEIWKEMTVDLQTPQGKRIRCTGVVVACAGNRYAGFTVSMLFTNISKHAQEVLGTLAGARLNGL